MYNYPPNTNARLFPSLAADGFFNALGRLAESG
jgi:hypothetical protein